MLPSGGIGNGAAQLGQAAAGPFTMLASFLSVIGWVLIGAAIIIIPIFWFIVKPMLDKRQYPYLVNIYEKRTGMIKPMKDVRERAGRFRNKDTNEETFKLYRAKVPIGPVSSEFITPDGEINLFCPSKGVYIPCILNPYNKIVEIPFFKTDKDGKVITEERKINVPAPEGGFIERMENVPVIDHIETKPYFDNQMLLQLSEDKEMRYWATTKRKETEFLHPTTDWMTKWLPIIMVAMMIAVTVIILIFGGQAMEQVKVSNDQMAPAISEMTGVLHDLRNVINIATVNNTQLYANMPPPSNTTVTPLR